MRTLLGILDRPIWWIYIWWIWGPRCPDDEPGCPCCDKWREFDWHINDGWKAGHE